MTLLAFLGTNANGLEVRLSHVSSDHNWLSYLNVDSIDARAFARRYPRSRARRVAAVTECPAFGSPLCQKGCNASAIQQLPYLRSDCSQLRQIYRRQTPESDCLRRSTTDAKHREQIVTSHAPMYRAQISWSSKIAEAKEAAAAIATMRREDIIQVALEIDSYIAREQMRLAKLWRSGKVFIMRAFGEAIRQQSLEAPTP